MNFKISCQRGGPWKYQMYIRSVWMTKPAFYPYSVSYPESYFPSDLFRARYRYDVSTWATLLGAHICTSRVALFHDGPVDRTTMYYYIAFPAIYANYKHLFRLVFGHFQGSHMIHKYISMKSRIKYLLCHLCTSMLNL
jgi:hypothetical protein